MFELFILFVLFSVLFGGRRLHNGRRGQRSFLLDMLLLGSMMGGGRRHYHPFGRTFHGGFGGSHPFGGGFHGGHSFGSGFGGGSSRGGGAGRRF